MDSSWTPRYFFTALAFATTLSVALRAFVVAGRHTRLVVDPPVAERRPALLVARAQPLPLGAAPPPLVHRQRPVVEGDARRELLRAAHVRGEGGGGGAVDLTRSWRMG